jgi:hypothetical protein
MLFILSDSLAKCNYNRQIYYHMSQKLIAGPSNLRDILKMQSKLTLGACMLLILFSLITVARAGHQGDFSGGPPACGAPQSNSYVEGTPFLEYV